MKFPEITKQNVKDKKVLVRVDYNVPINGNKVVDDSRIISSAATVKYLSDNGAMVFLVSHFGDPQGKRNKKYSLKKVVDSVSKVLDKKVGFVGDCVGSARDKVLGRAKPGDIFLLENTRFYSADKENDPDFSKKLAKGMDIFVYDAFSEAHRAHSSTVGVAKLLPTYAGKGFVKEINSLEENLKNPKLPYIAVVGGAKISTKIDILKALAEKVDVLIIGGGMANTIFVSEGYDIGKSFYEEESLSDAEELGRIAYDKGVELLLPDDVVVSKKIGDRARTSNKAVDEVSKSEIIIDVGPKSIAKFAEPLKFAGTIFWNGPIGIAEYKSGRGGTDAIARIIASSNAKSVVGGGDTLSAVKDLNLKFDYISTGGGATLQFVAGLDLPAIEMFTG